MIHMYGVTFTHSIVLMVKVRVYYILAVSTGYKRSHVS